MPNSLCYTGPTSILANAGVPMLFVMAPVFLFGLLPIIAVEAIWLKYRLALSAGVALKATAIANLASTLVGIPITWFALVILQMSTGGGGAHGIGLRAVTWQAPWLIPYEKDLPWMIPCAALFLNIPFFIASVFIEARVVRRFIPPAKRLLLEVSIANAISYALLTGFWIGALLTRATP